MGKTILLIHGRSFKPPRNSLRRLWLDAIRHGLQRDRSPARLAAFNRTVKEFIYYGDTSNAFLKKALRKPAGFDPDDTASRRKTLDDLARFGPDDFTEANYERRPGKSAAGEALADLFGGILAFFRISDPLIAAIAPDMREYWNFDSDFGSTVRATMIRPLKRAMDRNDRIMVIAHSLGSLIAYDTLWKFSRTAEYRPKYTEKRIDLFLSLGSPLADETVKRNLKGASASGPRRYPSNIRRWVNVAAEDDYIAHDQRVSDDYRAMIKAGLVDSIEDVRIYNLGVRDGTSNPHTSAGYLVHPRVVKLIADWV